MPQGVRCYALGDAGVAGGGRASPFLAHHTGTGGFSESRAGYPGGGTAGYATPGAENYPPGVA